MALLYADENFPYPTVEELRRLGHDVLTTLEDGQAEQKIEDAVVLAYAHSLNRAVLTQNRKHFKALHRTTPNHSGIIVCTFDPDFSALARRIDEAIQAYESLTNQLLSVVRPA